MTASVTPIEAYYAKNGHIWERTEGIGLSVMMRPRDILASYSDLEDLILLTRDRAEKQKYKDFKLSLDNAVNEAAKQREIEC